MDTHGCVCKWNTVKDISLSARVVVDQKCAHTPKGFQAPELLNLEQENLMCPKVGGGVAGCGGASRGDPFCSPSPSVRFY